MNATKAFEIGFQQVKSYIDGALDRLVDRLDALERRAPERGEAGKDGRDGRDADMDALKAHLDALVAALPKPENRKDADERAVAEMVSLAVARAVSEIPLPVDGKSVTAADVEPLVRDLVGQAAEGLREAQSEAVERALESAKNRLRDDMNQWSAERRSMSDVEFLSRASVALGKQIEFRQ